MTGSAFARKYGKQENWNGIVFRDGAKTTSEFCLDNTYGSLRIHCGRDRGRGKVFCPFDVSRCSYRTNYLTFGTMLFLAIADADFEIRIAHMGPNDLSDTALSAAGAHGPIKAGAYLGIAGEEGKSTGRHTHTEIVSLGRTSAICDELLRQDYSDTELLRSLSAADVLKYSRSVGMPDTTALSDYRDQVAARGVERINRFSILRVDYESRELRTFYNSGPLFTM